MILPVLEKRIFEFSFLGNAATQDIVLQPAIDVSGHYRVRLIVRVHAINAVSGNFVFKLQHTLPSDQDPQEFTDTTDFLTTASITNASPNIKTITGTDPQAFLKLVLRATQGTSGNTLYGEFSAVMVLRQF
jgi:hypothetical protein